MRPQRVVHKSNKLYCEEQITWQQLFDALEHECAQCVDTCLITGTISFIDMSTTLLTDSMDFNESK